MQEQNVSKWIRCLCRSKRFVPHTDILGQALWWMTMHGTSDSIIDYNQDELLTFTWFLKLLHNDMLMGRLLGQDDKKAEKAEKRK